MTDGREDTPAGSEEAQGTAAEDSPESGKAAETSAPAGAPAGGPESAEAGATPSEEDEERKPPARRGHGVLWTLIVLAVLAGVAFVTWPQWRPYLAEVLPRPAERAAVAERLKRFETRLAALEDTVNTLEGRLAGTAKLTDDVAALSGRLGSVEGEIGEVEKRLSTLSGTLDEFAARLETVTTRLPGPEARERTVSALSEIERRLDELESTTRAAVRSDARDSALVLAAGQLRAALQSAQPYADQLAAVKGLAGGDPDLADALATLAAHADTGVPTPAQLRSRFDGVARAVVRADRVPADARWTERILARLASVVSVRPTGAEVEGSTPEARVARAEARLARGDLAGAVAEIEGLEGPAAAPAADWLADARARLAANEALRALYAEALDRLAASPGGGT